MKSPVHRRKVRPWLASLSQKIIAGVAVALAVVIPRSAPAAKTQTISSFSDRAATVKKAIDQMAPTMSHFDSTTHLMQWYNWGNWNNWPNWGNWNNWQNWSNWLN